MRRHPSSIHRAVLLGLVAVLTATTLGGCFLFFPKKASVSVGSGGQGRIEGRLVDASGQPVAGASAAIPEVSQVSAVSGADGKFVLTGLSLDKYYVQVRKEGYLPGSFSVEVTPNGVAQFTAQLQLTAGNLHNGYATSQVCADCHKLHNPTSSSYQLNDGGVKNGSCYRCHAPGQNRGFDSAIYENSPHGTIPATNSTTTRVWTGQPLTDRGYCSTCHEPHGITGPPMMLRQGQTVSSKRSLNDLCYACHLSAGSGNTYGWPGKTAYLDATDKHNAIADPANKYVTGDCLICHVPHGQSWSGTSDPAMLRYQGNGVCTQAGCHPTKATSYSGHGKCTLCHDPHDTGTSTAVKVKHTDGTRSVLVVGNGKEDYRNGTWISNSYCQDCHRTPAPTGYSTAKDPFASSTNFKNSQPQAGYQTDANLHNVHVNRVTFYKYGTPWTGSHYIVGGDLNRVRCSQCHSIHQTSLGRNLDPATITSITGYYYGGFSGNVSGAVGSKSGCSVKGNCHSCYWCHSSPGSPQEACFACNYYDSANSHNDAGIGGHPGIDY